MVCPACGQRKARRDCPALGHSICSICCGTKRIVEIDCRPDCVHLASAREHPAVMVRRRQERDVGALLPTVRHLTERQQQLFFLFHSVIARHTPEGFARLVDDDVADAAGAAAATLETASRGVIYEHPAQSLSAQRLATELRGMLDEMRKQRATVYDGEAAITLRAIEKGAREVRRDADNESPTAYLDLMRRLLDLKPSGRQPADARPASSLILP